ncbi:FadD3 family acyl-CoA ligase [Saccharopolyspora sp. MS10]|uniref:FadD3 family acyl-CoA ligase n=1 Tax=Saccharopolyspora sp. MS10 TaxID=3385973 RepID=UPI0039A03A5F
MEAGPRTVPAALERAAELHGAEPAVVDPSGEAEVRLSYRELRDRVRAVAGFLLTEGVRPGDRVALNAPNTHHWVVTALAALHLGAVLVPISTRFTATETADVLRRSGARALVVAGNFLGRDRIAELRSDRKAVPRTVLRLPVERSEPPVPGCTEWGAAVVSPVPARVDELAAKVRPTDVSDLLYTSGTTGRSKGVLSAHRQSLAVAEAWAERGEVSRADRYLVVNPFFHSFGYKAGILVCLLRAAVLVPMPVFDAGAALELVRRERITVLPGPPTLYQSILDDPARGEHDLSSLRLAVTGAASVPVALVERMRRELTFRTVLTAYGLTEAVVATMCRADDDDETVATTCGRPAAGFELRIADARGRALPAGEVGEVLLRGPNTMLGYRDEPARTAAAVDADGWLRTGDLGRVDRRGSLTITGRATDMYVCGGFNVHPAEVEQAIARLPGVAEAAVVGVPDRRLGEVGAAYLVARPGHELTEREVLEFCRERLANYKVPRHVHFRAALPRTPTGKVRKRDLR